MSAKKNIIPVFVPHLGCLNDCVFCNQRKISGHALPATEKQTRDIIEETKSAFPGRKFELAFYGGSFTAIPCEEQIALLTAARDYIRAGIIEGVRISTRPDCIDGKRLDLLQNYGVDTIELGIQSMNDEVLSASKRGHTAQNSIDAMRLVKLKGFTLVAQMMTGLPKDNYERIMDTACKIAGEKPDCVRIYPVVVLKDTRLFELYSKGEYTPQSVDEAASVCAELIEFFETRNITVLRAGLNPSEGLSGGEAVAGAYHPAFGEIARSKIYLKKAKNLLCRTKSGAEIEIGVNSKCISMMIGQKRCNIKELETMISAKHILIKGINLPPGEIKILSIR